MNVKFLLSVLFLISSVSAQEPAIAKNPGTKKIPQLRLSDGRVFNEVSVRKLEAESVSILHDSGAATIPYDLLAPEDAELVGFKKKDVENLRQEKQKISEARKTAEEQTAKIDLILDLHFMHLSGTVIQVFPDGLLLNKCVTWRGGYSSFSLNGETTYMAVFESEGSTCRLYCDSRIYVDGSKFIGAVTPEGTYSYETTIGSKATVKSYTTDMNKILDVVAKDIPRPAILDAIKKRYDMPRYSFSVPETKK